MYQLIWVILHLLTGKHRIKIPQRLRNDSAGSGHFGATRTHGFHNGIDISVVPGEVIRAPFDMYVERESVASANTQTSGVRFIPSYGGYGSHGFIWYFKPYEEVIGRTISMGQPLGVAQDISAEYGGGMLPHVHIEQWFGDRPINIESSYV